MRQGNWQLMMASDMAYLLNPSGYMAYSNSNYYVYHSIVSDAYRVTASKDKDDIILTCSTADELKDFFES